jgi:hypothetical protein
LKNPVVINGNLQQVIFRQAAKQIGVTETKDLYSCKLHNALRQQLFDNIGSVTNAIPLPSLELHLDNVPPVKKDLFKLEAPLAVEAKAGRSGLFPLISLALSFDNSGFETSLGRNDRRASLWNRRKRFIKTIDGSS